MKKYKISIPCLIILIALIIASCNKPDSSFLSDADKQYIKDETLKVSTEWNKGKKDQYINRFSEDAIYMAPNIETITGKDDIRKFVNSFPENKLNFNIKEILGSSEFAYVRGAYEIKNHSDSLLDKGKFLSIWRKDSEENWQLTHDIFNSDLPI